MDGIAKGCNVKVPCLVPNFKDRPHNFQATLIEKMVTIFMSSIKLIERNIILSLTNLEEDGCALK